MELIYMVREDDNSQMASINRIKYGIQNRMFPGTRNYLIDRIAMNDFIVFSCLLGNDFIPKLTMLQGNMLKPYEILFDIYSKLNLTSYPPYPKIFSASFIAYQPKFL